MAKTSKNNLLMFLKEIISAIEDEDSFEGSLQYQVLGRDKEGKTEFEVGAFIRVGNSVGQGGCMLIEAEKDPNQPKMIHAVMHDTEKEQPPERFKIYYVMVNGSMVKCQWNAGWLDPHGNLFPDAVQKKFKYWADPVEFVVE